MAIAFSRLLQTAFSGTEIPPEGVILSVSEGSAFRLLASDPIVVYISAKMFWIKKLAPAGFWGIISATRNSKWKFRLNGGSNDLNLIPEV
jgi:hypothetical protein